jgi:predicted Fe-Mo cluster-binding NifX family protein
MKIAVSAETNVGLESPVSQHFGRCPYYVLIDLDENNNITNTSVVANPAIQHDPGDVPTFIRSLGVKVMIAGGMGPRAVDFFHQFGIDVATGASGTVKETLEHWINGELRGDAPCNDHHH